MSEENKQLALSSDHGAVSLNMGFMVATTLDEAIKIAGIIAKSEICPKNLKDKPGDVLVAMQLGAEVGLKPLAAIQNIAVINGRPSIWGDAMLAICRQSKQFEYITERYNKEDNSYTCIVKRRNEPEFIQTFSQADAKLANLWGKQGPWTQYPKRMLQMRARGFALRDSFPDLLRGIITAEEAEDYPAEKYDHSKSVGSIVEGRAEVPDFISESQLESLEAALIASESDIPAFCKHYGIESVSEAKTSQFEGMLLVLNKKIAKLKNSNAMKALTDNKAAPEIDVADHADFHAGLGDVDTETGEVI